jgi:hypothetical protein
MTFRASVKSKLLPHGRRMRRLPAGIGRGLRMGIDFQRGETQMYLGLYEVQLNRQLREIAAPGFASFDLGGHFGYDALILAKITGNKVLTVESELGWIEEMRTNIAENPDLPPILIEHAMVGDHDGDGMVTIDTLAARYFTPDLLKVDIEGAEADALRGARSVLRTRRPAILLEVHAKDVEWECLEILRDAGYDPPAVVERRTWLPERRPLEHNRWLVFPAAQVADPVT